MSVSLFEVNGTNNDVLLVTFGGCAMKALHIPPFEFLHSLTKWFPEFDKKFYIDVHQCWYHKGINDISTTIEETKEYLEHVIKGYKKVIFIGTSAGGYASILFGSLLHVSHVVAFVPQTILSRSDTNVKYRNLRSMINHSTQYHLYGDTSIQDKQHLHHISHVDNLGGFPNVKIVYKHGLLLNKMRDTGELQELLQSLVMEQ